MKKKIKHTDKLYKAAALAAMAVGIIYIVIQPLHPADTLSAVTTLRWSVVHVLSMVMDLLGIIALCGIYAIQVKQMKILGTIGYGLLTVFYTLSLAFHFIEAFVFPVLAAESPKFVESLQGLVTGSQATVNLGAIPAVYAVAGVSYLLGGTLLGVAIFRAATLARGAGALLAAGSLATLFGAVIPHPFDRIMAIPVGVALIWIGFSMYKLSTLSSKTDE